MRFPLKRAGDGFEAEILYAAYGVYKTGVKADQSFTLENAGSFPRRWGSIVGAIDKNGRVTLLSAQTGVNPSESAVCTPVPVPFRAGGGQPLIQSAHMWMIYPFRAGGINQKFINKNISKRAPSAQAG